MNPRLTNFSKAKKWQGDGEIEVYPPRLRTDRLPRQSKSIDGRSRFALSISRMTIGKGNSGLKIEIDISCVAAE